MWDSAESMEEFACVELREGMLQLYSGRIYNRIATIGERKTTNRYPSNIYRTLAASGSLHN